MHDLDRTQAEYYDEMEFSDMESDEFGYEMDEYDDEYDSEYYDEMEGVFSEADELELAAELLEVSDDDELDEFLGKLVKRGARAVRKAVRSPIGRRIRGALKGVAKKALPKLGAMAGHALLPGVGGVIGGQLASRAGTMLGLELEGLSPEDQEFEVAKQLVRLGGEAVKQAANAPAGIPPQAAANNALIKAAQVHAPGLVGAPSPSRNGSPIAMGGRRSGRWVRRGNKIILSGV